MSFQGGFFAGFSPKARDQGGSFGGHGRSLGQLGPKLGNAALTLGFAGFQGLELAVEVGLHLLAQLFEVLLFFAAGSGSGGVVAVGGVIVGHVGGPQPAPEGFGFLTQKTARAGGIVARSSGGGIVLLRGRGGGYQ